MPQAAANNNATAPIAPGIDPIDSNSELMNAFATNQGFLLDGKAQNLVISAGRWHAVR
jgi:hypothetical protein